MEDNHSSSRRKLYYMRKRTKTRHRFFLCRFKGGGDSGQKYEGVNFPCFGNEIFIIREGKRNKKSISRSTVDLAMNNALEVIRSEGCVAGPRKLGVPGAWSYLYSMFIRFGVIKQKRS